MSQNIPEQNSTEAKEMVQQHIAVSLRAQRKKLSLTQAKFAEKAGIDYRHYQELESGRVDPKISTLWKISKVLNLKISKLLPAK